MGRHWVKRALKFAVLVAIAVGVFGFAVMGLWNWLMPGLFGWRAVSFGQALGLLALSKILFGGFRGGAGRHGPWRGGLHGRWERMSPEERERFRDGLRRRCGGPEPQAARAAEGTDGAV
jgi:hypothetical protein